MKKVALAFAVALAPCGAILAKAGEAFASTLPGADERHTLLGGGVGSGAGVSIDAALSTETRLGFSAGFGRVFTAPHFDVRLAQRLPTGTRNFSLSLIAGAFGLGLPFPIGVEAGAGLAYEFTPRIAGRLNLVFGFVPFGISALDYWWSAPAAGFELAYQFTPQLEGSLGYNGRGEVLGLKLRL